MIAITALMSTQMTISTCTQIQKGFTPLRLVPRRRRPPGPSR